MGCFLLGNGLRKMPTTATASQFLLVNSRNYEAQGSTVLHHLSSTDLYHLSATILHHSSVHFGTIRQFPFYTIHQFSSALFVSYSSASFVSYHSVPFVRCYFVILLQRTTLLPMRILSSTIYLCLSNLSSSDCCLWNFYPTCRHIYSTVQDSAPLY